MPDVKSEPKPAPSDVKSEPKPAPPIETYYDLLGVNRHASARAVEIAFRRWVARYRPTTESTQLFGDQRFVKYLNAYLTLTGEKRGAHDTLISQPPAKGKPLALPTPYTELSERQRVLLSARIALWRREQIEGIHLLRATLDRDRGFAEGWALLGEFYFAVDRLEEGIRAYENATHADKDNNALAVRLQHARDALAGTVELEVEESPEEEMLKEERRQRRAITSAIVGLGLVTLAAAFVRVQPVPSALYIPWGTVITLALGMCVVFLGLSYGRLLEPFEHAMLWSSLSAGDRGRLRNYPYGMIMLVMAVPSMWLAFFSLLVMAFMDDEWPKSASLMLGACAVVTLVLAFVVNLTPVGHGHWTGTLAMGGNALVLMAMLGWWLGSLGTVSYQ
ncbi:MAG: J domain-containing protein [Armatimonadota bacterium]